MNTRMQMRRRRRSRHSWSLGTRWRFAVAVIAATLWLPSAGGGTGGGIVVAQGGKGAPSKIAALILDRIGQIEAARSAGTMSRAAAARLSRQNITSVCYTRSH